MSTGATCARRPTIALIGIRGCGKTTVGRQLATILGGDLLDTDARIVQLAGKSIAAIFVEEGEAGFRRREREVISRISADPPAVVSVGGGAVLDDHNVETLRRTATVVWLTAPVETLWERIRGDETTAASRPPLTDRPGLKELEHLLSARASVYARAADFTVDTTGRTPLQVAEVILKELDTGTH